MRKVRAKMNLVKVGVIGVGRMGNNHCRVYSSLPRAELVGVCDQNPELGRKIAREYEVPFYLDVDELLENVDAVSVATPTAEHFDLAMRCLEKHVHVLVEKPITETVEQAETLANAAEAYPVVVQVLPD